ncbi:outer membrane beta-barrel protein [Chryseobacterium sp. MYb264]|uniref:outer membrane beta-barrel protein n=1 Tax=Chryseobacterium sp. MYb264 TaxID=2745153 RepID=UPI002E0E10A5|nr:outer membrane beta-barrel protein [Chryseobacterium sp. MYb264]
MDDQWLNNLRNRMEDHSEDVPEGLWDDISDELFRGDDENKGAGLALGNETKAQEKIIPINFKTKVYRVAGVAAAIAVFFFVAKELVNTNHSEQNKLIHQNSYSNHKTKSGDQVSENQSTSKVNANIKTESVFDVSNQLIRSVLIQNSKKSSLGQKLREEENNDKIFFKGQNEFKTKDLFNQNQIIAQKNEEGTSNNKESSEEKDEFQELIADHQILSAPSAIDKKKLKKQPSKKWMLSMLTGNASSGAAEQFPGYATAMGKPMSVSEVYQSAEVNPFVDVLIANQNKEVDARVKHKTPVSFGLSMYYNIGKRWGIGTGINYTKLSSEIHSGSDDNFIKTDQSVHYIGVPVQVNYNVVKKGRFTGYITAGALAEKAVSGKQKTQYVVDHIVKEEFTEKVEVKPLQFSVNTAVGVQVKILNNIGLYAEPGLAYHFKDDSQLNTIYKEKPLNFNMKFGIRVQID